MLGDEEVPFPSDGSPNDLKPGGSIPRVWKKIEDLDEKIDRLCEDVAYIKGKLDGAEIVDERKFTLKSGVLIAGISVVAGVITSLFL